MADAGQTETLYLVKIFLPWSCFCLFLCPTKKLDLNFLSHILSICSCFEFHSSRNVGIIKVRESSLPISPNTKQKVTDHSSPQSWREDWLTPVDGRAGWEGRCSSCSSAPVPSCYLDIPPDNSVHLHSLNVLSSHRDDHSRCTKHILQLKSISRLAYNCPIFTQQIS